MGDTWISRMFNVATQIDDEAELLGQLGEAHYILGNSNQSAEMLNRAASLRKLGDEVRSLTSERVSEDLKCATATSGAMMTALLIKAEEN
jgi:hypothetical protein